MILSKQPEVTFTKRTEMLDSSLSMVGHPLRTCKNGIYSIHIYKYIMHTNSRQEIKKKKVTGLIKPLVGIKMVQLDSFLQFNT